MRDMRVPRTRADWGRPGYRRAYSL